MKDKINMLSLEEFKASGENESGVITTELLYQTYSNLYNQMSEEIERLSLKNKELAKENRKLKAFSNNFNHSIDKKTRNRVIKLLRERYTQKEIAESVGVSTSTVARIKKEEGIQKKGLEPKA